MKKFIAFTLAETLIVMGVIGVVAALTLPNLNDSTNNKEKVAKLKKIYQNLSDAYGRAVVIYGPSDEWYGPSSIGSYTIEVIQKNGERIAEFLKITNTGTSKCFSTAQAKRLDGSAGMPWSAPPSYSVMTADGTSVMIHGTPYPSGFFIDIDGPTKGTNTWGKDLFEFTIVNGEVYPKGYDHTDEQLKNNCFKTGESCTGWVVQNGNMDYLKADRTGKCPNNTQLSWTNTTCN